MDGTKFESRLSALLASVWRRRLASGRELDSGERNISVLFADIRGFTTFSEGREPAEIFSAVNRYAQKVSKVVRQHGGRIVEFSGDGIMAVFGAPKEVRHKERAAVASGRMIVAAMNTDGALAHRLEDGPLPVGVGIATGTDFVGNIRVGDRAVWTAIGNTSNLAARLQCLSRDLDAAIVIDRATRDASEDAAAGFECHENVQIRGRRNTEDVYILPLACLDRRPLVTERSLSEATPRGFAEALA